MGRNRPVIGAQFAPRRIDMMESAAFRALSLSARRVLDRLEIELAHHGGKDNGRLPVTFDDFVAYGLHRHAIGPAIREAVALGFVEITRRGRAGNAEWRLPNLFRLTYRHAKGVAGDGSHEWKSIADDAEALKLAATARAEKAKPRCRTSPISSGENRHRKRKIHSAESTTTELGAESVTTLDISGKGLGIEPAREARPPGSAVASEPAVSEHKANLVPVDLGEEAIEGMEVIQNRIAKRLGAPGWLILQSLSENDLERVTCLEAQGCLKASELELIWSTYLTRPRAISS
jgi:hypothetical protein